MITAGDVANTDAVNLTMSVVSPMPGRVVKVFVEKGQYVKKGDKIISVESMKMEYFVKATRDGVIGAIKTKEGDTVAMKQELATFAKEHAVPSN